MTLKLPVNLLLAVTFLANTLAMTPSVESAGLVMPSVSAAGARPHPVAVKKRGVAKKPSHVVVASKKKRAVQTHGKKKKKPAVAVPAKPPQEELSKMSKLTLGDGVTYSCHRGKYNINILDVDLKRADVDLKPIMAGESFNRLDEVKDQAQKVNAIAAVNANYFKKDGTPLGTLIVDGEWIAGPLFDRVAMGITKNKDVYIDCPQLHGIIETSNPAIDSIWVNNVNQPRRHGSRLILYTRRWGQRVKMAYHGALVAIDATGRVIDKSSQEMTIPYGGFVLSDTKKGAISALNRGDSVYLQWQPAPSRWHDVQHAVSGGPTLIRNGKLFVDLKSENFRKNWTSSSIHARTAAGVTRDKHLILLTVEGPHTLWDVAKALSKLGCVDAMNLDGGGSTTMVVKGTTVTRNKNASQRRVSTALAIVPRNSNAGQMRRTFVPTEDLTQLGDEDGSVLRPVADIQPQLCDPMANSIDPAKPVADLKDNAALTPDVISEAPQPADQVEEAPQKSKRNKGLKGWMKKFKL